MLWNIMLILVTSCYFSTQDQPCRIRINKSSKVYSIYKVGKLINVTVFSCDTIEPCLKLLGDFNERIIIDGDKTDKNISTYSTQADVMIDKIILYGHNLCNYSSGICFDNIYSKWVVWNKTDARNPICIFADITNNNNNLKTYDLKINDVDMYVILENSANFLTYKTSKQKLCNSTVLLTNQPGIALSANQIVNNWQTNITVNDMYTYNFRNKTEMSQILEQSCNRSKIREFDTIRKHIFDNQKHVYENEVETEQKIKVLSYISYVCIIAVSLVILYMAVKVIKMAAKCSKTKPSSFAGDSGPITNIELKTKDNEREYEYIVNDLYKK